jgi:hypothetical protein
VIRARRAISANALHQIVTWCGATFSSNFNVLKSATSFKA